MKDLYQVEYYTKSGSRVGLQISAYCSQDVLNYIEKMPDYSMLASYPERIYSNYS